MEDYNNQFQDLAVADIVITNTVILIIKTLRREDKSFRTYAAQRARSFEYLNLREQQLKALKKLVKRKTDVILIAKTLFGKSLIF
jgi:superfamily II DNA or RNA helicase